MIHKRSSGILLHVSSLPGRFGIGDAGPAAYAFADFLSAAKQSVWQILPLTPPDIGKNHSPYNSLSAFAGNPALISPEELQKLGLLDSAKIASPPAFSEARVEFEKVDQYKVSLFDAVVKKFDTAGDAYEFERFCQDSRFWLDDFALFMALSEKYKTSDWCHWPAEARDRNPQTLADLGGQLAKRIRREKILQYLFYRQWHYLKRYCNDRGISIVGDVPLYVAYQSADVWAHPELFKLTEDRTPSAVAGVPPDFFSTTGQLWGNPIYNWPRHRETGYDWWIRRIRHNLVLCDMLRIDHFRGLVQYWEVPAGSRDATNGQWLDGPGWDFFEVVYKYCPTGPFIVEDLGLITPDVREFVHELELPGMKVLMFAYGDMEGENPYLPHNHTENAVVYTGTHDNNTVRGWIEKEATEENKRSLLAYLGREEIGPAAKLPWEMIRMAMNSTARTCVIPMQDCLALGQEARMNWTSKVKGNWRWRVRQKQLSKRLAAKLAETTVLYGRG
jgi:4-alpha-glucanotransferase